MASLKKADRKEHCEKKPRANRESLLAGRRCLRIGCDLLSVGPEERASSQVEAGEIPPEGTRKLFLLIAGNVLGKKCPRNLKFICEGTLLS